jgi:hypothetical protein
MNHRVVALSVLAAMFSFTAARADDKAKKVATPLPKYWVGDFKADGDTDAGKASAGAVLVKSSDSPPTDVLLVQPLDPAHFLTEAKAETRDTNQAYKATYLIHDIEIAAAPMVIVLDAATTTTRPVIIKPAKKVVSAVKKAAQKAVDFGGVSGLKVAFTDLDADKTPDLAILFGCVSGSDGLCYDVPTIVMERAGKGWKLFPTGY